MTRGAWPALDGVLSALNTAPARTGSVIVTVYGDAILPRGGSWAVADLLVLMRRLGMTDGVVRTAISRLAKDGLLEGRRTGRRSAYAITPLAERQFLAATPGIYAPAAADWDGRLRLAFPEPGADRSALERAGFALLAPSILVSPQPVPSEVAWIEASGPAEHLQHLAARTWPLARLGEMYDEFNELFVPMQTIPPIEPLDAMAARTVLIHAWRRIALRDPHLPPGLLPAAWPGHAARQLCVGVYRALAGDAEAWLDGTSAGALPLPRGADPCLRFR